MWVGISPSSTICCTVKSYALVGAIALAFTLASGVGPAVSCKEAADVGLRLDLGCGLRLDLGFELRLDLGFGLCLDLGFGLRLDLGLWLWLDLR